MLPKGRSDLIAVIREAGDVVHVEDVVRALHMSRTDASKRLSRWTKQGWLRRVGRGAYVAASVDTLANEHVLDDPWVLVPALFAPAYIGGRTAAEHWDLTEQLFKDIVVVTGQTLRSRRQQRHGAIFTLKHINVEKIFGTRTVWRHHTKVDVSDLHRTIVDILGDPAMGGGIQHVADCLRAYLARKDRDDRKLIEYAEQLGNGAIFKRLGFLAERDPNGTSLIQPCAARLTAGNAKLDSAFPAQRLITKWKLWVAQSWAAPPRD